MQQIVTSVGPRNGARSFLYAYYSHPDRGWLRIASGPVFIAAGSAAIVFRLSLVAGIFALVFGAWSALKPFIALLFRLRRYRGTRETWSFDAENGFLRIAGGDAGSTIPLDRIGRIETKPWGCKVTVKRDRRKTFLVLHRSIVVEGELDAFIEALKQSIRRP